MNKLLIYLGVFLIALLITGISCAKDTGKDLPGDTNTTDTLSGDSDIDNLPVDTDTVICTFVGAISANSIYIEGEDIPIGCFAMITVNNKARINEVDYIINNISPYELIINGVSGAGVYTVEIIQ
jgi:hypothetical protein